MNQMKIAFILLTFKRIHTDELRLRFPSLCFTQVLLISISISFRLLIRPSMQAMRLLWTTAKELKQLTSGKTFSLVYVIKYSFIWSFTDESSGWQQVGSCIIDSSNSPGYPRTDRCIRSSSSSLPTIHNRFENILHRWGRRIALPPNYGYSSAEYHKIGSENQKTHRLIHARYGEPWIRWFLLWSRDILALLEWTCLKLANNCSSGSNHVVHLRNQIPALTCYQKARNVVDSAQHRQCIRCHRIFTHARYAGCIKWALSSQEKSIRSQFDVIDEQNLSPIHWQLSLLPCTLSIQVVFNDTVRLDLSIFPGDIHESKRKRHFNGSSVGRVHEVFVSLLDVNGSSCSISILFAFTGCTITVSDCHSMVFKRCWTNPSNQPVGLSNFGDEPKGISANIFPSRVTNQINRIFHYLSPHTWFNWFISFVIEVPLGFNPLLHKRTWRRGVESPATEVYHIREKYGYFASKGSSIWRWNRINCPSSFSLDPIVSFRIREIPSWSSGSAQALRLSRSDRRLGWNCQCTGSMD